MDKKQKTGYILKLICAIVFLVACTLYKEFRFNWYQTPMIIADVVLSLAFAATLLLVSKKGGIIKKIILFVAGILIPNLLLWGISMPFMQLWNGSGSRFIALAVLVTYIVYGIILIKDLEKASWISARKLNVVTACFLTLAIAASSAFCLSSISLTDTIEDYDKRISSVEFYETSFDNAIPQTEIFNIITDHFNSELPAGKTEKKCIVIGMDGTRADVLSQIGEHKVSGFNDVISEGGHGYLAYCGGVNYPATNIQDTSTAPGWLSILTGTWANEIGVTKNYVPKSNDYPTALTTLVESKVIDSSAFYVSWDGHFVNRQGTYVLEKKYDDANNLDVKFVDAPGDTGTYENVMKDIKSKDCTDFIFSIFEYCDHVGHSSDFLPTNTAYAEAFRNDDRVAHEIIEAIKARETYEQEDWLIIMTTDHGGYKANHGGPTKQERYTFIVTNKEISR